MKLAEAAELVKTQIMPIFATRGRVCVAIDGRCASGKTTLATALAVSLGATVFHADDFFLRPEQRTAERLSEPGGNMDRERLKAARAELRKHGITCEGKRARLLTKEDGEYYDLLLCMDESNIRRAQRIVGDRNAGKCKKLLSLAGGSGDVADPWYTGDFTATYRDIMRGIEGLLVFLDND